MLIELAKVGIHASGVVHNYLREFNHSIATKHMKKHKTASFIRKGMALTIHNDGRRKQYYLTTKIKTVMEHPNGD